MTTLSNNILQHLRVIAETPDFLNTNYSIRGKIGAGGMGSVFLADDIKLGREVAIKVLNVADLPGELKARMVKEAKIIARLQHPGIVPIHEAGMLDDDRVYYVMKLVRGEGLAEYRNRCKNVSALLGLFLKICETIQFAHKNNIIHRDIKPENIMIDEFEEVLVLDWGIAKMLGKSSDHTSDEQHESHKPARVDSANDFETTGYGDIIGTPAYMAPEQARGEIEKISEKSDVYALGGVLYFLLSGDAPKRKSEPKDTTKNASDVRLTLDPEKKIPSPLRAVIFKAMAPNPADRYPGVAALSGDIERHLVDLPVKAMSETILQKFMNFLKV